MLIVIAIMLVYLASGWRLFTKAGQPGWAILIPIYGPYVYATEIGDSSTLMFVLALLFGIPWILINIDVAENFGKSTVWGLGLSFLGFIFVPLLAFGDATYQG